MHKPVPGSVGNYQDQRKVNWEGGYHDKHSNHWRGLLYPHYAELTGNRHSLTEKALRVLVLDKNKRSLMPCRQARARKLLSAQKASLYRRYPFTIILKERDSGDTQPISLKIDPGSKTTGIALVAEFDSNNTCVFALNIGHRGHQIKVSLEKRRAIRRSRRNRHCRYRPARFLNRKKQTPWLPLSLMSRVHNVETWTKRLKLFAPVSDAQVETVRFDMQLMENADIQGVEYQQGTLKDWEQREYLLYRNKHTCAYCAGLSGDKILNKEHIMPKVLGGSNQIVNLTIACRSCNEHKGKLHPKAWIALCSDKKDKINKQRAVSMAKILTGYRPTLRDAAAVNATRYAVGGMVKSHFPNTQFFSGGRTKKNRSKQLLLKDHWIDAACVGHQGANIIIESFDFLSVTAQGHGSRQMCRMDKFGLPRTSAKNKGLVHGFKTGDLVTAQVSTGKKKGFYTGRIAVRSSGFFNIKTSNETVQGISHRNCRSIQKGDGYGYFLTNPAKFSIQSASLGGDG